MQRIVLSSLIIFSVTVVLSQSSFYYYKGNRVPLNEDPLARYVCLDRQISEEEVTSITRQLENTVGAWTNMILYLGNTSLTQMI